jgi:succinyl-diaminopimelate desuccinylase
MNDENGQKKVLLGWIDEDRDILIDFLSRFIQAKSPDPPGDTREAAGHKLSLARAVTAPPFRALVQIFGTPAGKEVMRRSP